MNDEPIFTKCGRELYEKKCLKTAQGGPVKKNTLYDPIGSQINAKKKSKKKLRNDKSYP